MENQMEKNMENEMRLGLLWVISGLYWGNILG